MTSSIMFSLVVPAYDEEGNVRDLLLEVAEAFGDRSDCEMILVDDCSVDRTVAVAEDWRSERQTQWLRVLQMDRNSGQSAAILAGVLAARGQFILTVDGDRQNDPADLPRIMDILLRGEVDGVTGIRANRRDNWIRRLSSRIGNAVRNGITGDAVADSGCGIKGYRREVFLAAPRFNGMHRFMATLARIQGARVVEIEVNHRPRVAGVAKYGVMNRAWRGLVDCLAIRWYRRRAVRVAAHERTP